MGNTKEGMGGPGEAVALEVGGHTLAWAMLAGGATGRTWMWRWSLAKVRDDEGGRSMLAFQLLCMFPACASRHGFPCMRQGRSRLGARLALEFQGGNRCFACSVTKQRPTLFVCLCRPAQGPWLFYAPLCGHSSWGCRGAGRRRRGWQRQCSAGRGSRGRGCDVE